MKDNETKALARQILTTGKMIHDLILQVKTEYFANASKKNVFADLSMPQLHAIMMVRTRESVSVNELSKMLYVSPPSASTMVDRLVEKGVFTREQSQEDRRKVIVKVSNKAEEVIQGVEESIFHAFVGLVEMIGSKTARKWSEVLEQVKTVMEKEK